MAKAASSNVIINVCPTGMVATREQNPHLPVTSAEIISTVLACAELGASVFHLHARDDDGRPTWKKEAYARIISSIREKNDRRRALSRRRPGFTRHRFDCDRRSQNRG